MSNISSGDFSARVDEQIYEKLASREPMAQKQAELGIDDYVRIKLRERAFSTNIMELKPLQDSELTPSVEHDENVKVCEKEPDSPPAATVPYRTTPIEYYIDNDRFAVHFQRIQTMRHTKDLSQLRTWRTRIRAVIADQQMREIDSELDRKFLVGVNYMLGGAQGQVLSWSGVSQWRGFASLDRISLVEGKNVMGETPGSLTPTRVLANFMTWNRLAALDMFEWGGDGSQDMMVNGFTSASILKMDVISTVKHQLVPTNTLYYFAPEDYLGKGYELQPVTIVTRDEGPMISFYYYCEVGATIANLFGLARTDHAA